MAGLASTLLVGLMVTGCAPDAACPASGWFSTVGIHLEGNLDDVAVVQMCAADGCAASAPLEQEPGKPFHASASGPGGLENQNKARRLCSAGRGRAVSDIRSGAALLFARRGTSAEWRSPRRRSKLDFRSR